MSEPKSFHILSLDPGFAFLGYSVINVSKSGRILVDIGIVETQGEGKKKSILAVDDNIRRVRAIHKVLNDLIVKWDIKLIGAESMSHVRSSSASAKVAMVWGVIVALTEQYSLGLYQASPQQVKTALTNSRSASKNGVEEAVLLAYPTATQKLAKVAKGKRNHAFDALAVGETILGLEATRLLQTLL